MNSSFPEEYSPIDHAVGAALILCALVGVIGNAIVVVYFWERREESLPDLIYSAISTCEIISRY